MGCVDRIAEVCEILDGLDGESCWEEGWSGVDMWIILVSVLTFMPARVHVHTKSCIRVFSADMVWAVMAKSSAYPKRAMREPPRAGHEARSGNCSITFMATLMM